MDTTADGSLGVSDPEIELGLFRKGEHTPYALDFVTRDGDKGTLWMTSLDAALTRADRIADGDPYFRVGGIRHENAEQIYDTEALIALLWERREQKEGSDRSDDGR